MGDVNKATGKITRVGSLQCSIGKTLTGTVGRDEVLKHRKALNTCGVTRSAQFLDDIKNLGYYMAFRGGLSFNLGDVLIPAEKEQLVAETSSTITDTGACRVTRPSL